jgi:hypothetical protein
MSSVDNMDINVDLNNPYHRRRYNAIRSFIDSDSFLIAGTNAWYGNGVHLGQTIVQHLCVVYNDKIEGVFNLVGISGKFKFVKTKYPQHASKEFWVIDLLNHINSLDITQTEAITHIKQYLNKKVLDHNILQRECINYGTNAARSIINKAVSTGE